MASESPSRPTRIGQYNIVGELGHGGMGIVWLGDDPVLKRHVAIKVLPPALSQDTERLKRFIREAQSAAKLNHPNTVTIYQVGREGDTVFIAMEVVAGGSLEDEIKRNGPMRWRDATRVIRDAAAGLAAAHAVGLVHRDIKPANLLRTRKGVTKVADFGLARPQAVATQLTQAGLILGTPNFMAPEQFKGAPADARSDLYSLICTYYALLTGHAPFQGPDETPPSDVIIYRHLHEPFPDARTEVPRLPDAVCSILTRGSEKEPARRHQTAQELLAHLDALASPTEQPVLAGGLWELPTEGRLSSVRLLFHRFVGAALVRRAMKPSVLVPMAALVVLVVVLMVLIKGSPRRLRDLPPLSPEDTALSQETWPPIEEVAVEWLAADEEHLARIEAAREQTLQGLPEHSLTELSDRMYASGGYTPVAPSADTAVPELPARFVLSGRLTAVRVLDETTWVCLVRDDYDITRPVGRNVPHIQVVFEGPKVAEWMADYRVGETIRVVVQRQDWGEFQIPAADVERLPLMLSRHLGEFRVFGARRPYSVYWCLQGQAVEKAGQPLTWIDAELGRAQNPSDRAALLRSPGMMFRNLPEFMGTKGLLTAKFKAAQKVGAIVCVVLDIPDSLEGPIRVIANMGPGVQLAEFVDYEVGGTVHAEVKLVGYSLGRYASTYGAVATMYRWLPTSRLLSYGPRQPMMGGLLQYHKATGAPPIDPLTAFDFMVTSCRRIQLAGQPSTLVASGTGRRKVAVGPEVTPDVVHANLTETMGEDVTWSGELNELRQQDGETHFLVAIRGSSLALSCFEAFTAQEDFIQEVCDYLSGRETDGDGDTVSVKGRVCAADAARWRLRSSAPLIELTELVREDAPNSRAIVRKKRDPRTVQKDRVPTGLSALLRDRPPVGTEVEFTALYEDYADYERKVRVSTGKTASRHVAIDFPEASRVTFSDYRRDDAIEVTATFQESGDGYELQLEGKTMVRLVNPLSLVTREGREVPPLDFSMEKELWTKIQRNTDQHAGEKIQMAGVYEGFSTGPSYYTISIGKLFFEHESIQLISPQPPSRAVHFVQEQLRTGDEVLFEAIVSGTLRYRPKLSVTWMRRIGEPNKKVPFSAETVPQGPAAK